MKEGLYSKFQQPVYFALSHTQTSMIKYQNINLHYTKFKNQPFSALITQYTFITKNEMVIDFHGLIIKPELLIQEIIQTKEEQRVFQYVINKSHQAQLTIPKKWCQCFNKIVHRIINSGKFSEAGQKDNVLEDKKQDLPTRPQSLQLEEQTKQSEQFLGKGEQKEQLNNEKKQQSGQQPKQQQSYIPKLLIYWVDDEPKNNQQIIQKQLNFKQLEIKQVTTTQTMISYIQHDYQFQKKLGRTILFISDMARMESYKMNFEAGIDLFQYIYHTKQLTDPGIAFVSNTERTIANMQRRKLKAKYIKILSQTSDLLAEIKKYLMQVKK